MARKPTTKDAIKRLTVKDMKSLGVYKIEYDPLIDIYVDLRVQYLAAMKEFTQSGCAYETKTAAGGSKKSAIVGTMEVLRKDLLAYSDRLCLNPKAIESVTLEKPKESALVAAMRKLQ
ncbi:terminase [Listeriaceae bacterium FSL A5-0209]|nr:terminase [Listeriaceae bacterium FSL A5-0209]